MTRNSWWNLLRPTLLAFTGLLGSGGVALAIPDFASQTGEPCTRCHIGAFGPQLTPFGRAFKIGGYTQSGGEGLAAKIPLSVMVQSSFTNTRAALPDGGQAHHYDTNNNFSLDQISVFVAGRVTENTGGFMQFTWSDVSNQVNVDDVDLRPYTTLLTVGEDTDLRLGTTINNNPTMQDPYNSTPAWGFPYISSLLAPGPAAAPVLERFGGSTIGYTVYAWYDRKLYLEAGAYTTPSAWLLTRFGNPLDPGAIIGGAPYLRAAYEWQWNDQAAHIGALYLMADVNPADPAGKGFASTGVAGQDRYTDYAFDAGYQFLGDGTHIVTAQAIYIHEDQRLNATSALLAPGSATTFHLEKINANVSYWYQNTYGITLGWTKTWGSANPLQVTSDLSANNKPNSNAFIIEADWVPFGKAESLYNPFVNLKLGLQYTAYTQFNGGSSNFDGTGRRASDNNTLLLFAWLVF